MTPRPPSLGLDHLADLLDRAEASPDLRVRQKAWRARAQLAEIAGGLIRLSEGPRCGAVAGQRSVGAL